LDMSGNVWEWTHSIYKKYPYTFADGREELQSKDSRSLRGGSFYLGSSRARCAYRDSSTPDGRDRIDGFASCRLPSSSIMTTLDSGALNLWGSGVSLL
jgi:formylglycine-generating enzyme required for sulfatase activity